MDRRLRTTQSTASCGVPFGGLPAANYGKGVEILQLCRSVLSLSKGIATADTLQTIDKAWCLARRRSGQDATEIGRGDAGGFDTMLLVEASDGRLRFCLRHSHQRRFQCGQFLLRVEEEVT